MTAQQTQGRGQRLLAMAQSYHAALAPYRRERERNKRYNYGDQWGDNIDVDGQRMTEGRYILEQGNIPLKNNLIRRLVRNVVGVYATRASEPVCHVRDSADRRVGDTLTTLLRHNHQTNRLTALYTRSMEEFLISGFVVHRKSYGRRCGRLDCWTDYVQPNNFFYDPHMRDFRGWDCGCVGEVHDVPFDQIARNFATDADSYEALRGLYGVTDDTGGMCRVYEVWRRESRRHLTCHDRSRGRLYTIGADCPEARPPRHSLDGDIRTHWSMTEVWRYYFVTPDGHILAEGDTPYAHGGHPYVFKGYPMIDGEIHSFVGDVVDQQRYTNRLITLYDWIMRASAKGVLLVPEDCVPRGCDPSEFADAWSRYNGVIFYKPSPTGHVPQQVSSNSTNVGIKELLDVQLKFFEDISGVNNALQGKTGNVAISAELFGQQTQNATTTLLDILDTYGEFVKDCAIKDVSNLRQYYDDARINAICGEGAACAGLRDADYDISIESGTSRRADIQSSNAMLMEIWKSGQISLEQMLRAGQFPFADALLRTQ